MTTALVKKKNVARVALIDAVLVGAACLIPTLSHLTALPLYRLNPMMLVLLGGMAAVRDPESGLISSRNALLLAVMLPVVSMLAVGMPAPAKALCMAAEMLTVVAVASAMERYWGYLMSHGQPAIKRFAVYTGMILSAMLCGKIVYYLLKALLLAVMLPVVSMLAVGMPAPAKALCMAAEMLTVVAVASAMERYWGNIISHGQLAVKRFAAYTGMILSAMLCGKIVYYLLKALLLPSAALVGTPLLTQAVVMVVAAGLYALLLTRKR